VDLSSRIIGAHSILYSRKPEADRAFLRDVIGLPSVDVGGGWLIFGLPPAEVAVHPSRANDVHEFYLMCDDVKALAASLRTRGVRCGAVRDQGCGTLGIYQPRHARPKPMRVRKRTSARGPRRRTAPG
jgi:hypothetical protein